MITKQELVDGIRFAGKRAAAAGANAKDWNHQLGHQWTTRDAFSHLAATAGGAAGLYPLLDAGVLSGMGADRIAQGNASAIDKMNVAPTQLSSVRSLNATSPLPPHLE